jgi:hypothetical protein
MPSLFNEGYEGGYQDGIKECEPYMREWISVKDRLPEKECFVLVYIPHENKQCMWWREEIHAYKYCIKIRYAFKSRNTQNKKSRFYGVTHWMNLPSPPITEENKNE